MGIYVLFSKTGISFIIKRDKHGKKHFLQAVSFMIWYLFSAKGFPLGLQWWVNLYKNRKETAINKRGNNTQNNTKTQNTQNRKQTYTTRNQTYKTRKQS